MYVARTRRPSLLPVAVVALVAAGCDSGFDPPYLINKLRILGVQASPPELRVTSDTSMQMLVAGQTAGSQLCYAWAYCPFAWSQGGNFRCIDPEVQVDLGTAATASVGLAQVFAALQNAPKVFTKLGLTAPAGTTAQSTDLGCFPGGKAPPASPAGSFAGSDLPDSYILFQVAEASQYGGTCPASAASMLAKPCADRDACLAGYKRLGLAPFAGSCGPFDAAAEPPCPKDPAVCPAQTVCGCDGKTYANDCERVAAKVSRSYAGACRSANENPRLPTLGLHVAGLDKAAEGIDWPADVTPVVSPGATLELWPRWFDEDIQVIGPSADPALSAIDKESLLFSWFLTAGEYGKPRTTNDNPKNTWVAPALPAGKSEVTVTVWVVVRDGRNGTDWQVRQLLVRQGAAAGVHPLCAVSPALPGCPAP